MGEFLEGRVPVPLSPLSLSWVGSAADALLKGKRILLTWCNFMKEG